MSRLVNALPKKRWQGMLRHALYTRSHPCVQVRAKAVELGELEERYWHDFNDFQIQLRAHVDERDVLLRKVCTSFRCISSFTSPPL